MRKHLQVFVAMFFFLFPQYARSEIMDAAEVVGESWKLYRQHISEKEIVHVSIKSGTTITEKIFTRWIQYDSEGEDKITIIFSEPRADNGLGLLTWRHEEGNDEQWLKLASMDKERRVAIDDGKYFGGTDFIYEDVRMLIGERVKDFEYRFEMNGSGGWVIAATPKPGIKTFYGKRRLFVERNYSISKIEYYDAQGKLIKTVFWGEIEISANGSWRPTTIRVDNRHLGRSTTLKVSERKLDLELNFRVFTVEFLREKH